MITFMAFIINIGIFVKAKINLQNATDAAAFAGASVQARQLTNIGYMNWAMRNVFKEWMFKYYVLGGLNLEKVSGVPLSPLPGPFQCPPKKDDVMDFTMGCYKRTLDDKEDIFNFPSICMDFANTGGVGLCTRYLVPGLPRFDQQNVLGMDATTNAFIDTIVAEKSRDCSLRTKINFSTAKTWAFNVTDVEDPDMKLFAKDSPQIAINLPGAFPQAFELALRMRNLESEVNFPPQTGVCGDVSSGVDCAISANQLTTSHQERALKAYLSAWRNLGNDSDNEMKESFTLTEIPPKPDAEFLTADSLSTLLIPDSAQNAKNKYYLDLKLITVNYSTFYTGFTTTQNKFDDGVSAEGACDATKMGMPIPGYPLHFIKNPDVLTYYAVEGKAEFVGLFNPFAEASMILKAYAAAKPFGGRIGPQVFDVSDRSIIKSRSELKSSPFISGFDESFLPIEYEGGKPIPTQSGGGNKKFWMTNEGDNIGGFIADGNEIFFGIPNMIYDYPTNSITNNASYQASEKLQLIGPDNTLQAGLYNVDMFEKFKSKLRNLGGTVTPEDVADALVAIRSPTLYDAHNFLIPTPEKLNSEIATDSFGYIQGNPKKTISIGSSNYEIWNAGIYGPLFSPTNPNFIYKSPGDLREALERYIERQEPALLKYKSSLNLVAANIFNNNASGATGQNTGAEAARIISDLTDSEYTAAANTGASPITEEALPSCNSIAGSFVYFYSGRSELVSSVDNCITPLPEQMQSRWANTNLTGNYLFEYALPVDNDLRRSLFSAFHPSPFRNARQGVQTNPTRGSVKTKIRNFYSTKFIPVNSVTTSDDAMFNKNDNMLIYSEGAPRSAPTEIKKSQFKNPLQPQQVGIDLSRIRH